MLPRNNIRMLQESMPEYQVAKRARFDQLAMESQEETQYSVEAAGVLILMLLATAILIVWLLQEGWWNSGWRRSRAGNCCWRVGSRPM